MSGVWEMYSVTLYNRVRRACHVDGMSKSAAGRFLDRPHFVLVDMRGVRPGSMLTIGMYDNDI